MPQHDLGAEFRYAICGKTGKRRYRSRREARTQMRRDNIKLMLYRCRFCGGVHATSKRTRY